MRLLSCPISSSIIDDSQFKVAGFFYILLLSGYLFGGYIFLIGLIFIDILMRLSPLGRSPILLLSVIFVKAAKLKYVPRNEAPKRFALTLGTIMLLLIMITHIYSLDLLSFVVASNLLILKLLDVVLDYCVGCKLYGFLMLLTDVTH
jgi:hypothetical protein